MSRKYLSAVIYLMSILLLSSCATTTVLDDEIVQHHDKTVSTYKKEIQSAISTKNLILADKRYLSMRGDYPESKLLPTVMLDLALAHMEHKEYLLSSYYCDSYIKDYPYSKKIDYAEFLKVKGVYLQFVAISGDHEISSRMHKQSRRFVKRFKKSKYRAEVKKMIKHYNTLSKKRNEEIALMYERTGKTKAAAYYRKKR